MSGARPIGVGLISLGWMGRLHSKAYLAVPATYPELGVRPVLVHAADTAPDRAEYARNVLGYRTASADYRAVLDDPAVDVVSICAPNALHREIALAAAEAGKPFWIEKPVGRDAAETAEIAAAAAKAELVTSVGYNYRNAPAVAHIRELVAGGELGRVTSVRCVFLNGQAADPRVALSWRYQREHAGSGVLGDLLCHVADLVTYAAGPSTGPIAEVSAASAIVHARRPIAEMGTDIEAQSAGAHETAIESARTPALQRIAVIDDRRPSDTVPALQCLYGPARLWDPYGLRSIARRAAAVQFSVARWCHGISTWFYWCSERRAAGEFGGHPSRTVAIEQEAEGAKTPSRQGLKPKGAHDTQNHAR